MRLRKGSFLKKILDGPVAWDIFTLRRKKMLKSLQAYLASYIFKGESGCYYKNNYGLYSDHGNIRNDTSVQARSVVNIFTSLMCYSLKLHVEI